LGAPFATAIPGDLTIGDGVATCIVSNLVNLEIADTANVVMNDGSIWDLNGWSETVNSLTLGTAVIAATGSGTLSLVNQTITMTGFGSLYSALSVGGGGSFTIQGAGNLDVYGIISGAANIVRNGNTSLGFHAANTFTGSVTLNGTDYFWINNSLALGAAGGGVTINDSAWFAINGSITVNNEILTMNSSNVSALYIYGGANIWNSNVVLNATATVQTFTACSLEVIGAMSGPGGVTKNDAGKLIYSGSTANTYVGTTTVNGGILELHKTGGQSIPSGRPLIIGDGVGGVNADVVRQTIAGSQIITGSSVTINSTGWYDLNGFDDDVGPFTFTGGHITTGAGTLTVVLGVTATASPLGQALIEGKLLFTSTQNFNMLTGPFSPSMVILASISGAGGLIKFGISGLELDGANTYTGPTIVQANQLSVGNSSALGAVSGGTVVSNGAAILLTGGVNVPAEPLSIGGSGATIFGALWSANGAAASWAGPITLTGNTTIGVVGAGGTLNLSGAIGGTGNLTKVEAGTLTLSGAAANTYAGTTTVSAGTLVLSKSDFILAVPSNLAISNGATARLAGDQQTSQAADVLVNGLFDFATFAAYLDTLHGTGNVNFGVGGWIYIGLNDGSSTFDGNFTGTGYALGWTVGKNGVGTFTHNGNSTYTAGVIHVLDGTMLVNGSQPPITVIVDSTATLGGSGTVGPILANGNIAPGASPGILTSGNLTFSASGDYFVDLTGPNPGTGYDQMNVLGTNNLANAVLHVNAAFTSPVAVSNQFVIINNDGADAITGTFLGLANNATFSQGGYTFRINYSGTFDNDVTLTLLAVPGATAGFAVSSGNGDGSISPNECNNLSIVVTNKTGTPMTGVSASLASASENVIITQPFSPYSNIPANGKGTNIAAFQISTTTNFVCGTPINLLVSVTTSSHGAFTVPISLPSGLPAAVPSRYDNNITTNIPDVGTIESTNIVAGFTGPLTKIGVSLFLTHTFDADLNISLVSPDGVVVDLSSGNGGSGDDYGTSAADGNRTTFDDAAGTLITAGSAPFVGTFKPEGNMASTIGGNINGSWRLRVQDANGGSSGALRNWSLFLYGVQCSSGGGLCELCPNITIMGDLGAASPKRVGYLNVDGVNSACGSAKPCPGLNVDPATYSAEQFTFHNGPSNACVTATLEVVSGSVGMAIAAYSNSFNAGALCANYIAGPAAYVFGGNPQTFSFNVTSNANFILDVLAGGPATYKLTVAGGDCRPVLNLATLPANKAHLDWTTAAGGYQLESTNVLAGGGSPIWGPITNVPIVLNGRYHVTNNVTGSNIFYHLRKPVP
jgi:autotransporter-associated beta strand protein